MKNETDLKSSKEKLETDLAELKKKEEEQSISDYRPDLPEVISIIFFVVALLFIIYSEITTVISPSFWGA